MIIASACLAGFRCRYDAKIVPDPSIVELVRRGEAIPVCPELFGGLPCPRTPAERTGNQRVVAKDGRDVTEEFVRGAEETLRIAKLYGCSHAILKAKSPSCGLGKIYDGTFSNVLKDGNGITTDLLLQNGVTVEVKE